MNLIGKYRAVRVLQGGDNEVWESVENGSGRLVLVHLVGVAKDQTLAQLNLLGEPERQRVLEFGEHDGQLYAVTEALQELQDLQAWLARVTGNRVDDPLLRAGKFRVPGFSAGAGSGGETPSAGPGEFTRLFKQPETGELLADSIPTQEFRPPVQAPEPSPSVGEFTSIFGIPAVAEGDRGKTPMLPADVSGTSAKRPDSPGDFTQLFQRPVTLRPEPSHQPRAEDEPAHPSEFTEFFESPSNAMRKVETEPLQESRSPSVGGFTDLFSSNGISAQEAQPDSRNSFTQLFQTPVVSPLSRAQPPEPPVNSLPSPSVPGEFTSIFGSQAPKQEERPPSQPAVAPRQQPTGATGVFSSGAAVPAAPNDAPGEYTRLFSKPAMDTAAPDTAEPLASPEPASSSMPRPGNPVPVRSALRGALPLIITLNVLALAAIALILYFVLRR